MRFTDNSY